MLFLYSSLVCLRLYARSSALDHVLSADAPVFRAGEIGSFRVSQDESIRICRATTADFIMPATIKLADSTQCALFSSGHYIYLLQPCRLCTPSWIGNQASWILDFTLLVADPPSFTAKQENGWL